MKTYLLALTLALAPLPALAGSGLTPLPAVHGVTGPDPEWTARCLAEESRRSEMRLRELQKEAAAPSPAARMVLRAHFQVIERYRRMQEEICLRP